VCTEASGLDLGAGDRPIGGPEVCIFEQCKALPFGDRARDEVMERCSRDLRGVQQRSLLVKMACADARHRRDSTGTEID